MTPGQQSVAVVVPCRNSRHLLWRSLASVAAQTLQPSHVLVLDRGSSDGLDDWLQVRWPGIELWKLAADADTSGIGAAIRAAVSAPAVAVLRPGDHWQRSHLATLVGGLPPDQDIEPPALLPTSVLGTAAGAGALPWPAERDTPPSPQALEQAVACLPVSADAILLDLRAVSRPAGLLDLRRDVLRDLRPVRPTGPGRGQAARPGRHLAGAADRSRDRRRLKEKDL